MIGVARYFRDRASTEAEAALTLHDDYQKRGIGTYLMRYLAKVAVDHGITTFRADVLPGNTGMMRVFHKISRKVEVEVHEGVQNVRVTLPRTSRQIPTSHEASEIAKSQ